MNLYTIQSSRHYNNRLLKICGLVAVKSLLQCFYRAMHFSAKRGMRYCDHMSSVCLSVYLSVCSSVTLVDCDHIGWNSSKLISPLVSLGCSLFATPT